jgi:hypothetical protein
VETNHGPIYDKSKSAPKNEVVRSEIIQTNKFSLPSPFRVNFAQDESGIHGKAKSEAYGEM